MQPLNPKRLLAAERRRRIAELYLQGQQQEAIASAVGVKQGTVSRVLNAIRREWREAAAGSIADKVAKELAKIDLIEAECWAAYKADAAAQEPTAAQPERRRLPAAAALANVRWCSEQRAKIEGLYAPAKIAPTTPAGEPLVGWDETAVARWQEFLATVPDGDLPILESLVLKEQTAAGPAALLAVLTPAELDLLRRYPSMPPFPGINVGSASRLPHKVIQWLKDKLAS